MENKDRIRVIIWDFDNVLGNYKSFRPVTQEDKLSSSVMEEIPYYDELCYMNGDIFGFMEKIKGDASIEQGLLCHVDSALEAKTKLSWIKARYHIDLNNYCISPTVDKVTMLKAIAADKAVPFYTVLFVSNDIEALNRAYEAGFHGSFPTEFEQFRGCDADD